MGYSSSRIGNSNGMNVQHVANCFIQAHTCRVSRLVKTSVVDVSRRRRSVSTAVKSTQCLVWRDRC